MKAIFFDLDGTLGGHGLGNGQYLEKLWKRLSAEEPELSVGDAKHFLSAYRSLNAKCWGDWVKKELLLERHEVKPHIFALLLIGCGMEETRANELAPQFQAQMEAEFPDHWQPAEGVREVLEWAQGQGYVLGVLSNGHEDEQRGKLRDHGLLEFFQHPLFSASVGFSKPDPRYFEYALSLVGCEPGEVCVIGDSFTHDIEPAQQRGMKRIWIYDDANILGLPDDRSVWKLSEVPEKFAEWYL